MPNNTIKINQQIIPVPWSDIEVYSLKIARWIERTFGDADDKDCPLRNLDVKIYGIPRGGMIPAILVSHILETKYKFNVRFIPSLDHLTPKDMHRLVVIDDICDSGETFKIVKQLFPMAKTAVLFRREGAGFQTDFHCHTIVDDRWLVFPWEVNDGEV